METVLKEINVPSVMLVKISLVNTFIQEAIVKIMTIASKFVFNS